MMPQDFFDMIFSATNRKSRMRDMFPDLCAVLDEYEWGVYDSCSSRIRPGIMQIRIINDRLKWKVPRRNFHQPDVVWSEIDEEQAINRVLDLEFVSETDETILLSAFYRRDREGFVYDFSDREELTGRQNHCKSIKVDNVRYRVVCDECIRFTTHAQLRL